MKLIPTIGIEVHVELNTEAKIFSLTKNSFSDAPNTNVNEIDLGYPGTLPSLNKKVIESGLMIALALKSDINMEMHFDRKNYFYVDNPKNFQITQNKTPIGKNGYLEIFDNGKTKKVYIEELHIEEDTCKSIHSGDKTYLNYNRAGIPLIEIVTKPVIKSAKEAALYIETLKETLEYLAVSDVKIEEGSMRCDANVSLAEEASKELGVKTEIKNIGSISNVETAIEVEIERQKKILENGEIITEETRRFDDSKGITILMRKKETGNDYRYFPEPDIPNIVLSDDYVLEVKNKMPVLPSKLRLDYFNLGLNEVLINSLIKNKDLSDFYNKVILKYDDKVAAANLLTGDILSNLHKLELKLSETKLTTDKFLDLLKKIDKKEISLKIVKKIIVELLTTDKDVDYLLKEKNMKLIRDPDKIIAIIEDILKENENSVNDYKNKKERAVKFLMGQIMKTTKGMVDPSLTKDLLIKSLDRY